MILSYNSLLKLKKDGYGVIDAPIDAYQAASIDVTLGTSLKRPKRKDGSFTTIIGDSSDSSIEYQDIDYTTKSDTPGVKYFQINAHEFVLASIEETIKLHSGIAAHIEGKSSIGRSGLFIQNASWINPGFEGQITLEIYNANDYPVYIYSGMKIGQIIIEALDSNTNKPYDGRYSNQRGATPPITRTSDTLYYYKMNLRLCVSKVDFYRCDIDKESIGIGVPCGFIKSLDNLKIIYTYEDFNVSMNRNSNHLGYFNNNYKNIIIVIPEIYDKLTRDYVTLICDSTMAYYKDPYNKTKDGLSGGSGLYLYKVKLKEICSNIIVNKVSHIAYSIDNILEQKFICNGNNINLSDEEIKNIEEKM